MVYRVPPAAPESQVPPDRRGRVLGHYCLVCASLYPLHRAAHAGRPVYGRDHIASPCAHEGEVFKAGESWWEPGVEMLPAPAAAAAPPSSAAPPAAAPPAGSAAGGASGGGAAVPAPAPGTGGPAGPPPAAKS
jgi:hypothetical protein